MTDQSLHEFSDAGDTPAQRLPAVPGKHPFSARKAGHNQWTRAKMAVFLRELAATHSVQIAAKAAGMNRSSAYRLRARLVGTPFDFAWEVALEMGMRNLAHAVMDRALNGEEVVHYYRGELVGTSRRFDNRLAMWVLGNPWKVGRHQIAREYSAEGFERLLERIEWASLDWEDGEELPGRIPPPLPELDEYGCEIVDEEEDGDGGDPTETPAGRDQDRFLEKRSWYAALATEESRRRGRRYDN